MIRRVAAGLFLLLLSCGTPELRQPNWTLIGERVWRSPSTPAAYALVDGDGAIVFGAPLGADLAELQYAGVTAIEGVYLTHHHRDTAGGATAWSAAGIPVKAPRASAPWITPEGVQKFWRAYVPAATPPTQAPAGAQVIDGKGKTLLPGLWDCHMHVGNDYTALQELSMGVTSVRDPGNDDSLTLDRRARA